MPKHPKLKGREEEREEIHWKGRRKGNRICRQGDVKGKKELRINRNTNYCKWQTKHLKSGFATLKCQKHLFLWAVEEETFLYFKYNFCYAL